MGQRECWEKRNWYEFDKYRMGREKGMNESLICWIILNHRASKDTRQGKVQFKLGWNIAGGILWDLLYLKG